MESDDHTVGQLRVLGAKDLRVVIDGSCAKPRDWIGNAHADEDIVGMVFAVTRPPATGRSPR